MTGVAMVMDVDACVGTTFGGVTGLGVLSGRVSGPTLRTLVGYIVVNIMTTGV